MLITIPGINGSIRPGKLVCIGQNYAAHAREMNSPVPLEPIIFLKPSTAIIRDGDTIVLPDMSDDVHYEVELVVAIGGGGRNIAAERAPGHIAAYAVGIDMTARDLQNRARKAGLPWAVAKGFDTFAPLGEFVAAQEVENPDGLSIRLSVNGETRQDSSTSDMVFGISELIAYSSTIFTLESGDLIFTGTPEGVGPVRSGDTLVAEIGSLPGLTVHVR